MSLKVMKHWLCSRKLLSSVLVVLLIYLFALLKDTLRRDVEKCVPITFIQNSQPKLPVVKIYGIGESESNLDIVKSTFTRLGYKIDLGNSSSWEVLWSYTYPFYSLKEEFQHLKPYQKVNHFPGSGFITQKNNLAILPVAEIPKSFLLPTQKQEFLQYAEENKNVFWVIKNTNHRGIKILNGHEDLYVPGTFVQEFINKPLLINGKKFDLGVYVMLTSIDPLRVYLYSEDVLLRFCKKNYFPLNINLVESYVVGDDYLPVWEVPDLKQYYLELNYTAKEALNAYLQKKGKSTKRLWSQVFKIIQNVYFTVENDIKRSTMSFGSLRNFFELVRFDFIADEHLKVYLLEVNMSPNLSSAHFPQNRLLYEQIVFHSLHIVGLVLKFHDTFHYRGEAEVSERDLQVNAEQCSSFICHKSCENNKCQVCNQCLNNELKQVLRSAYLEHTNRGKFRRVIPAPLVKGTDQTLNQLSPMNRIMDMWFRGKCLQDASWCL